MKATAHIGDVNPIEHGGGYVFKTENQTPILEYFDGLETCERIPWDLDLDDPAQTDKIKIELYVVDLGGNGQDFLDCTTGSTGHRSRISRRRS